MSDFDYNPLDEELYSAMDDVFEMIKGNLANRDTDDQLKRRIVYHNLNALAQVILLADANPEMTLDLKRVALGILGTADWIAKGLPELPEL